MSDQSNVQGQERTERDEQPQGQTQPTRTFNPNEHLIQLKAGRNTKDYLPVQWRLVWFRTVCPQGTIETEMVHLDLDRPTEDTADVWNNDRKQYEKVVKRANGIVLFKATVRDGKGGVATGTKSEKAASFPDFIEKAETGAIGRALAALGYGTQFAPELDEAHRIVDSPIERYTSPTNGNGYNNSNGQAAIAPVNAGSNASTPSSAQTTEQQGSTTPTTATEQQLSSIRKLCEYLGKAEPQDQATMSFLSAKKLIQQLTAEYREQRQSKAS